MDRLADLRQHTSRLASSLRRQRIFRDRLSVILMVVSAALNIITILTLVARLRPSSYPVPVHYSTFYGFNGLGPWYDRYWLGIFGLVITIVNAALAALSFQRSRITSFYLLTGSIVVGLFALIITNAFLAVS